MKLKNKKTGEIIEFDAILPAKDVVGDSVAHLEYGSLAELNAEWEDYEEPKEQHYYIEPRGQVIELKFGDDIDDLKEELSEIGNYFETEEEAEKAVEKLKAWKRLKDNGFEFEGTNNRKRKTGYFINYYLGKSFNSQDECEQAMKDLDLLFGGEE